MSAERTADHAAAMVEFFDHSVIFERLIWIAAALTDIESSDLAGFWEDCDLDRAPAELKLPGAADCEWTSDEFAEHLNDCGSFGFLAKVSTPYFTDTGKGYFVGRWSGRYTHWLYAESLDELRTKAIAWAEAQRESDCAPKTAEVTA